MFLWRSQVTEYRDTRLPFPESPVIIATWALRISYSITTEPEHSHHPTTWWQRRRVAQLAAAVLQLHQGWPPLTDAEYPIFVMIDLNCRSKVGATTHFNSRNKSLADLCHGLGDIWSGDYSSKMAKLTRWWGAELNVLVIKHYVNLLSQQAVFKKCKER